MADGRVERGERNRAAIIDATYALIREGSGDITAEQIAARARVGLRTVFRQFEDLDELFARVAARVAQSLLPSSPPPPPTGELAADVHTLVERRAKANEQLVPFLRAARRLRREPTAWREQQQQIRTLLRRALERALAPHLADGSTHTVDALELVLSAEAWERLRHAQRLSAARASEVVEHACLALVGRPA